MKIYILLLGMLLLTPLVIAHSIETEYIIRSDGEYNIKFSTNPKFPLVHREIHLDFEIWDNEGKSINLSSIKIMIVKNTEKEMLQASKNHDHYELTYVFDEPGTYKIIPSIKDAKNIEFEIEVDSFGYSGIARSSVIIFFLLIIIASIYKDYKKHKKWGNIKSLKKFKY